MSKPAEHDVAGLKCGDVLAALSDFLDGDLDPAKQRQIAEHLRGCDWCEKFGGRFSEVIGSIRRELADPAPLKPEVAARLRDRLAKTH